MAVKAFASGSHDFIVLTDGKEWRFLNQRGTGSLIAQWDEAMTSDDLESMHEEWQRIKTKAGA